MSYGQQTITIQNIIDRAIQICDLINCDFFSTSELLGMFNDQMQHVYAALISCGDKTFTNRVVLQSLSGQSVDWTNAKTHTWALPDDFSILEDIYIYKNGERIQLDRLSVNFSDNDLGYEIQGNNMYLYNCNGAKAVITYWYIPADYTSLTSKINLPHNIIIKWAIYLVAVQMKIKQNQPYAQMKETAAELLSSYKTLIDRDRHDYEKVRNVYGVKNRIF